MATASGVPLLEVRDLRKHFPVMGGFLGRRMVAAVKAVDGVSFSIQPGETLSLVGESGCGKTTTSRVILLLEPPTAGSILFEGQDISHLKGEGLQHYRASVQAVFQDPWSSLNPRQRVGGIVGEPLAVNAHLSRQQLSERVAEVLTQVGLRPEQASLFPHEFSGGQRQRIAIARALSLNPRLIVLDEPVSALDVSIRAQIMNLLRDLQKQHNLSYLMIAHHLASVRYMSHRIAVMYLGKLVETADSETLFRNPQHPYTKALISAALPSHPDHQRDEIILPGEVPSPLNPASGCRFRTRCPLARTECAGVEPPLKGTEPGHKVACVLY